MPLSPKHTVHPLCAQLRELRKAAGMSLLDAEERLGVHAVVLGSYERGDRNPPLLRVEEIFNKYGYTIEAVPITRKAVRLPDDIAAELRAIADYLENRHIASALLAEMPK